MSVWPVCNVGVLWPNDWMDEDATWYRGRPWPGNIVLGEDPAPPLKGHSTALHFSAHVYCGQMVAHHSICWALVKILTLSDL